MVTMKKIRIKSFILHERTPREVVAIEEPKKASKISKKETKETITEQVPSLKTEKELGFVDLDVSEKNYGILCHVILLYGIPFKLIENGIEIDITEKEPHAYKKPLSKEW